MCFELEALRRELAAEQMYSNRLREMLESIAQWTPELQEEVEEHGFGIAMWRGCVAEATRALTFTKDSGEKRE
jgi:hypothetical protein